MYQISIVRRAIKDLSNLPDNYPTLVGQHINNLAFINKNSKFKN